jgi:Domain of unknown function (DUF2703)
MRSLPIVWRRLVSPEGKTCDRCGATQQELERAVAVLDDALRPLGIEPHLEIVEIDEVCGGSECRTVEVEGTTFEAVPLRLILKAALVAAAELIDDVAVSA